MSILISPIITEKATGLSERNNQATFEVALHANKHQIRQAVEAAYPVSVRGVRTLVVRGKRKRRGQSIGRRPGWKKAIIKLAAGNTIDFFATE